MTIKDMIDKCLVALDEVSSANLQENIGDYEHKLPPIMDSVQRELAVLCRGIESEEELLTENGSAALPELCYEVQELLDEAGAPVTFACYGRRLYCPDGNYTIRYLAYPTPITALTPGSTELEIEKDAQEAMVFGVCAGLCINDEPDLYVTYLNRYQVFINNILSRINERATAAIDGGVDL